MTETVTDKSLLESMRLDRFLNKGTKPTPIDHKAEVFDLNQFRELKKGMKKDEGEHNK